MGSVINFLFTALTIGIPFIITNKLHFPNSTIAFLETGFSIGILAGSIGANVLQKRGSLIAKLFIPLLAAGGGLLLLGVIFHIANSVVMVDIFGIISMIVISFSVALVNVSLVVRLQKTIPTKILGRVSSTLMTANQISMPIGTLVFTFIFQLVENSADILIANGVITIGYVLICIPIFTKNLRQDDKYLAKKELE